MHAMLHDRKFQIRQRFRCVTLCDKELLESFPLAANHQEPAEEHRRLP